MLLLFFALPLLLVTAHEDWNEDKIIGGQTCVPNSQPWQVALFIQQNFHCGGVLLSDRWVITAAHCKHGDLRVFLGKHHIKHWEPSQQIINVERQILFPAYNPRTSDNDLMLLYLEKPAKLTPQVKPIELAKNCTTPGTSCLVSGWGTVSSPHSKDIVNVTWVKYPTTLQCLNINIISDEKCKTEYNRAITSGMVCAGVEEGGMDSCQGDSGGPLVCNGVLQGLVSWGMGHCALPGYAGVYTNLCRFYTWILNEMKKD